jgi:hypothetical protein
MRLPGKWNWYLPSWLEWILNIGVEGHLDERQPLAEEESVPV